MPQPLQRRLVQRGTFALPRQRTVGGEAEPGQVLQNRVLVLTARTLPVVILDPKQDMAAFAPGGLPHVDGVDDMTEMKVPGGGGSESRDHHDA